MSLSTINFTLHDCGFGPIHCPKGASNALRDQIAWMNEVVGTSHTYLATSTQALDHFRLQVRRDIPEMEERLRVVASVPFPAVATEFPFQPEEMTEENISAFLFAWIETVGERTTAYLRRNDDLMMIYREYTRDLKEFTFVLNGGMGVLGAVGPGTGIPFHIGKEMLAK